MCHARRCSEKDGATSTDKALQPGHEHGVCDCAPQKESGLEHGKQERAIDDRPGRQLEALRPVHQVEKLAGVVDGVGRQVLILGQKDTQHLCRFALSTGQRWWWGLCRTLGVVCIIINAIVIRHVQVNRCAARHPSI